MVYFWQKQSRQNRHYSPKTSISPLLSAATTAADTVLAAVVSAKSEKKIFQETNDADSTAMARSEGSETGHLHRGSNQGGNSGGVVGGERDCSSNNNNGRGQPSSPGCRGHSSVMTNKIQSLVLDKLSEYARRKQESNRRRVAERELDSLNMKIDKLLSKMDDGDAFGQGKLRQEEECVVCLAAPATMKTFPCGHRVVCRKCLIKTMQVAISQRCLPLRCVICRNRILSLQHSQDSDKSSPICLAEEDKTASGHNAGNPGHSSSRMICRSNTTPVIVEPTPVSASNSSPSSPVSQQSFVSGHHQARLSCVHTPGRSSQGTLGTSTFHRHYSTTPEFHAPQSTCGSLHKKSNSKSVKRLLDTK